MPAFVRLLEIHAANACNLTCESCAHFSNSGHRGMLSLEDADLWMKSWRLRIVPGMFRILGGEPTLNPNLPAIVEMAAGYWRRSRIGLTTNGFFLHRHPELPALLSRFRVILRLTVHHQSEEYQARLREVLALLDQWRSKHFFELIIENGYDHWSRRHRGFGAGVLPFENDNPRKSWENCPAKNCMQLFRNRLWKCPSIAYLHLQKEAYPGISKLWDPYLKYGGLASDCSDAELSSFVQWEDEAICGMCAMRPEPFEKPSPLVPHSVLRANAVAA